MRKLALVLVASLLAGLAGCSLGGDQTYTSNGLSITMPKGFAEKQQATYTIDWESSDSLVLALKEDFAMLESAGISPDDLDEAGYLEIVKTANGLDATVQTSGDITYLTFENTANGKEFFYLGVGMKGADAFWFIQFACEVQDQDKFTPLFLAWAGTITFDA
jgi:hypothetical protein